MISEDDEWNEIIEDVDVAGKKEGDGTWITIAGPL